ASGRLQRQRPVAYPHPIPAVRGARCDPLLPGRRRVCRPERRQLQQPADRRLGGAELHRADGGWPSGVRPDVTALSAAAKTARLAHRNLVLVRVGNHKTECAPAKLACLCTLMAPFLPFGREPSVWMGTALVVTAALVLRWLSVWFQCDSHRNNARAVLDRRRRRALSLERIGIA